MIKDIVVNLSVTKGGGPAGDFAVSLASIFGAQLTGLAFVYDPIVPVSATGYIPAEIIERQQADNEGFAKSALERFGTATKRAGLSAEPLTISTSLAGAGEHFSRIARRFDLAVLGQAEPDTSSIDDIIAETTLFESGRPIIIVPYIQKGPVKLDRAMVCWDGSRPAARAIGDAMPLLAKAGKVEIVSIADDPGKEDKIEGVDMSQHLARHGLKVEVERIPRGDVDVADALLSHAADSGADIMVMGGYGHSRLRQFLLGGVTRSTLRSMTVPVLMAH
jgi:nucleotide-binding universal stress UspA family protein